MRTPRFLAETSMSHPLSFLGPDSDPPCHSIDLFVGSACVKDTPLQCRQIPPDHLVPKPGHLETNIRTHLADGYEQVFREWLEEGVIEFVDISESNSAEFHYLPQRR
ncbi:hypothetical protein AVEN_208259-1 [Araneus ventricosus]|uniref:Uncharacterized protein n=1 Tax=Araneus ventricosus TaxID=182803 RepID=A0A4Y2M118_ARAVE|nr:hypothetical protein AVEN_208259-1 [Araneus ventricosus]